MNPLSAMQYLIIAAIAAIIFSAGFGSGFTVQGWRKDAAAAAVLKTASDDYHKLELATEKQNSGVALLNYQLDF